MPLVLHGGTGIPEDMIKKAISLGVAKINVNTECQTSFADATRAYIEAGKDQQGKGFDPRKAIADLGIDFLAAGIGNIHGKYPANWQGLNFDVLAKVKDAVGDMPLVLHGGTGIPEDMIKKAISLGVAKINVNTDGRHQSLHRGRQGSAGQGL